MVFACSTPLIPLVVFHLMLLITLMLAKLPAVSVLIPLLALMLFKIAALLTLMMTNRMLVLDVIPVSIPRLPKCHV